MAWDKPLLRMVDQYHLLPQAYTYGLAFTLEITHPRKAFLLGQVSDGGWWYYFPVAMAVKSPLATITMLLAAIGALFRLRLRGHGWAIICLTIPAALYAVMAVRSNLNIGVRHMMPVVPLAFIAIGVVMSRHTRLAAGLLVLLAVESAIVFPNDLAYFNLAAGGSRGGVRILSDSNLDWGQDLPLLAEWQRKHPEKRLYLSYFGTSPPSSYGVTFTNVGAGYNFLPTTRLVPGESGVIAVSATHLQGLYVPDNLQWFYKALREQDPIAVLGGTIYLYEWR
jgi:hypothetical protein